MHDLGLAAWFGATLANAVALNRAAGQTTDANDAGRVANGGWDAWTPVNAVAIGAHLDGSVGQLLGNKGRLGSQAGVASMSVLKTVIPGAALGVTAYRSMLGRKVSRQSEGAVSSGTEPSVATPPEVASSSVSAQSCQWADPPYWELLLE